MSDDWQEGKELDPRDSLDDSLSSYEFSVDISGLDVEDNDDSIDKGDRNTIPSPPIQVFDPVDESDSDNDPTYNEGWGDVLTGAFQRVKGTIARVNPWRRANTVYREKLPSQEIRALKSTVGRTLDATDISIAQIDGDAVPADYLVDSRDTVGLKRVESAILAPSEEPKVSLRGKAKDPEKKKGVGYIIASVRSSIMQFTRAEFVIKRRQFRMERVLRARRSDEGAFAGSLYDAANRTFIGKKIEKKKARRAFWRKIFFFWRREEKKEA